MAFKDIWRPRVDGVDDADSSAVNEIAEAVIDNEDAIKKNANNISKKQDKLTDKQLQNIEDVSFKQNALSEEQLKNIQDVSNKADTEYVNKTFTNILKGSASGQSVTLTDISPIEHTMGVKVRSKNIAFDSTYMDAQPGGANGVISTKLLKLEKGKTYTISFNTENTGARVILLNLGSAVEGYNASSPKFYVTADGTRKSIAFTMADDFYRTGFVTVMQRSSQVAVNSGLCSNLMIEEGEVATRYTDYVEDLTSVWIGVTGADGSYEESWLPTDGTLEFTSTYPTMNFMSSDVGVVIDITYNRDINKAFADIEQRVTNLENAVISLGGNV